MGYITVKEAAKLLGVKVQAIYNRVYRGKLKFQTRYGIKLIDQRSLKADYKEGEVTNGL